MLAHGYTIEAACDGKNCPNAGTYYTQDSFYGQNKRLAFAEMRAAGWTWSGYNCLCPKCSKKTPDRRKGKG